MRKPIVLVMLVVVFAVATIELRHHTRLRYAELQQLYGQRDALNVEWGRLLLEQGAWAEHRRVESLARKDLAMTLPDPARVVIVYRDAAVGAP